MPTLTFTWNTFWDNRTCKVCASLHGYQWFFYDEMPTVLIHPQHGVVWDLVVDMPRTHGKRGQRGAWNCRCRLIWEINDTDLQDDLLEIRRRTRLLDNRLVATTQFLENFISLLVKEM